MYNVVKAPFTAFVPLGRGPVLGYLYLEERWDSSAT